MDFTVWKYEIPLDSLDERDEFTLLLPEVAKPLSAQVQHGVPQMWVLVIPGGQEQERRFRVAGTGHRIQWSPNLVHIDTFQMHGGALVFHVFERRI